MKKVLIIGSPGSGKSYFAKELEECTKLPLYHLDMIYHREDGTHLSDEEFYKRLDEVLNKDEWIIDGNYQSSLEYRLKKCDTVFLYDLPTDICIKSAIERIGTKREDLPWVEQELDEEFKQEILGFREEKLPKIYKLLDKYNDKKVIIFKSREEKDKYLENMNK